MITFIYDNSHFSKQIEYCFETLIRYLTDEPYQILTYRAGKPADIKGDLVISYGKACFNLIFNRRIHIYESKLFGKDYLKPQSLPEIPLKRYGQIPIIYSGVKSVKERVTLETDIIKTDIDVIASSFFMLTRYEEFLNAVRDEYDRFTGRDSVSYKENFIDFPIVNEYIELLWNWIKFLKPRAERKSLWEDRKFAVFISHDVDHIRKFRTPYALVRYFLFEKNLAKGLRAAYCMVKSLMHIEKDPAFSFEYISKIEQENAFKSSYYFMSSSTYNVKSNKVKEIISYLLSAGNEVGLHPNLGTYRDIEKMSREKNIAEEALGYKVKGCRQHYLQASLPITWRIQDKLGFAYDTSVAFHDVEGYRAGICYPYQVFDIEKNCRLNLIEIPLVLMDATLKSRYTNSQAFEVIVKHIGICRKYNGVLSMLWHNDALDFIF